MSGLFDKREWTGNEVLNSILIKLFFFKFIITSALIIEWRFWDSQATKDFTKKRRNNFYSGICIPDSCGSKEAELFLYKVFESKSNEFNYNVKISVSDRLCSTKEIKELSREAKFLG